MNDSRADSLARSIADLRAEVERAKVAKLHDKVAQLERVLERLTLRQLTEGYQERSLSRSRASPVRESEVRRLRDEARAAYEAAVTEHGWWSPQAEAAARALDAAQQRWDFTRR